MKIRFFVALGGRRNLDNGEQLRLDNHNCCRSPKLVFLSWTKRTFLRHIKIRAALWWFLLFNTFEKDRTYNKISCMNKIIVIGPSGAGKSEMSRKLHDILDLPLYHLDNIFWKKDRTHISRDEFDIKLNELLSLDKWIIDGDYSRTYEIRIEKADTIIFLDYPLDTCLQGIESRIGKPRTDIPWKEDIFDPEFKQWIIDWFKNTRPRVLSLLEKYKSVKRIVILSSRKEGDEFINSLQQLLM